MKNKHGSYSDNWKYINHYLRIPIEGEEGFIEDKDSNQVLGIMDSGNVGVLDVVLLNKTLPIKESQKWLRGMADNSGYFSLLNPSTGKVLTWIDDEILIVRGILKEIFFNYIMIHLICPFSI